MNIKLFMLHKTFPPISAYCNFKSRAAKLEDELLALFWKLKSCLCRSEKEAEKEEIFLCEYMSLMEEITIKWIKW